MGRRPSTQSCATLMDTYVNTSYDTVKLVADNLEVILETAENIPNTLKYLGAHASNPTLRLDGSPIVNGDYYFNTVNDSLVYYDQADTSWLVVNPSDVADARNEAVLAAAEALVSEANAKASEVVAVDKANVATTKASEASVSATEALVSQNASKLSEDNSKVSETNAISSELAASGSASDALVSENNAKVSETNSKASETVSIDKANIVTTKAAQASQSATEALNSKVAAKTSEDNAKLSETEAKASEVSAGDSATIAITKANEASASATLASDSETVVIAKAGEADASAIAASGSASAASVSESNAEASAVAALVSENNALFQADRAEQYADSVANGIIFRGDWDASTGLFPTPTLLPVEKVDVYNITVAGTLSDGNQPDVIVKVSDQLNWHPDTNVWYKLGGAAVQLVTSVDGMTGDIVVDKYTKAEVDSVLTTKVNVSSVGVSDGVASLDATGKIPLVQIPSGVGFSGEYGDLTNIPTEFVPIAHVHSIAEVNALQTTLDGKANVGDLFSGSYGDLTGVPASFTPTVHAHTVAEVTGLQTELDGKANTGDVFSGEYADLTNVPTEFTPVAHSHSESEITDLDKYSRSEIDSFITGVKLVGEAV